MAGAINVLLAASKRARKAPCLHTAESMMQTSTSAPVHATDYDVVLIGGGIMSATLGAMLSQLQPDWSIAVYERLDAVAQESSDAWNNAGTGHSALCELNYTPELPDGSIDISKAISVNEELQVSKQFCHSSWTMVSFARRKSSSMLYRISVLCTVRKASNFYGRATSYCPDTHCSPVWSTPKIAPRSPSGHR